MREPEAKLHLWEVFQKLSIKQKCIVAGVILSIFGTGNSLGLWYQGFQVAKIELEKERAINECTKPPIPKIKITTPNDSSQVDEFVDVEGSFSHIADHDVWVAVYSYQDKKFFPHRMQAKTTIDSTWIAEDVRVGTSEDDSYSSFEIVAFTVDKVNSGLPAYFEKTGSEGFASPLDGMTPKDRISVTRKP